MNKGRWSMGLSLLIVVIGIAMYAWSEEQSASNSPLRKTARVAVGAINETVVATGVIRPVTGAEVNVGSRISGTVVNLPVQVGDQVTKGQLLAELDAILLEAEADTVRAELALSLPKLEQVRSALARRQRLADKGLASAEDLELAQRDVAVEEAQLDANRARLRSAEIALDYTRITAPISGIVAEVSTREGETVAAAFAAPNFVTIVDLSRLEVLAYVDEIDIGRVFIGQTAVFTVDTWPEHEFEAKVVAIQPKAELQGGVVNYLVRLVFSLSENFILRPEMTAHIRILVEEREMALTIPRAGIKRRSGSQYVTVQREGEWQEQIIQTGWRSEQDVEVISGLKAGEVLELNPN